VWDATIYHRNGDGTECPFCNHSRICPHYNLLVLKPDLCKKWCYELNKLGPENYSPSSHDEVWWKCTVNPCGCHVWSTAINNKNNHNTDCPYCLNMKLCPHNNLLSVYPDICQDWSYQHNKLNPENYAPNSGHRVYWICRINPEHIYLTKICNRTGSMKNGCSVCNESVGETCVRLVLNSLNINFTPQWTHDSLPRKRFDFFFIYNNELWLIEYDGIQHFKEIAIFHKEDDEFEYRREIDKIKTFVACTTGYKLIRIDHTNRDEESIRRHILRAFELNSPIYYSDDKMYEWLSKGTINMNLLKQHAPKILQ
ncbi:Hypothetical protein HVR_LOCUS656, partial [uncultured virus]